MKTKEEDGEPVRIVEMSADPIAMRYPGVHENKAALRRRLIGASMVIAECKVESAERSLIGFDRGGWQSAPDRDPPRFLIASSGCSFDLSLLSRLENSYGVRRILAATRRAK